jgi:hypothetical protein
VTLVHDDLFFVRPQPFPAPGPARRILGYYLNAENSEEETAATGPGSSRQRPSSTCCSWTRAATPSPRTTRPTCAWSSSRNDPVRFHRTATPTERSSVRFFPDTHPLLSDDLNAYLTASINIL